MTTIKFRPFTDEDIPLLASWLEKEYIKKWFHDPENWLIEVRGRHQEFLWLNHFIVTCKNVPVGFCQYYDCFDARDFEDWYKVEEPGEVYSMDYLIGNEKYLGKGFGKEIVKQLTELIRLRNGKEIIVQPERENALSNVVLERNNYRYDTEKGYYTIRL